MILVFGATGKSGAPVANELEARGVKFRVFVRKPQDAANFESRGIEAVIGDIHDPASLTRAFAGVDKALFLSPGSVHLAEEFAPVLAAAREAGVSHFVRLSVQGGGPDSHFLLGRLHGAADELLKQSGLAWTLLKPTFFMQNFLGMAAAISGQGAIYAPAGNGKIALIDCRDIGAVAAAVLTVPEANGGMHCGQEYTLTGPEALTHGQVAEVFSAALNRPVQYVDVPLDAARASMLQGGMPEEMADALVDLMREVAQTSRAAGISPDVARITGRPPRSFQQFVADHLTVFQNSSAAS